MVNHSTLGDKRLFKFTKFYGVTKCSLQGSCFITSSWSLPSLSTAMKATFLTWVISEASADGYAKVTNLQKS